MTRIMTRMIDAKKLVDHLIELEKKVVANKEAAMDLTDKPTRVSKVATAVGEISMLCEVLSFVNKEVRMNNGTSQFK